MKNKRILQAVIAIAIAVFLGILLTVLSAVPPLSLAYSWFEQKGLALIWQGLEAGVIAACLLLYLKR